jgi:hypothetical protein
LRGPKPLGYRVEGESWQSLREFLELDRLCTQFCTQPDSKLTTNGCKYLMPNDIEMAPEVGLEPTTNRLTADRSTTELLRNFRKRVTYMARGGRIGKWIFGVPYANSFVRSKSGELWSAIPRTANSKDAVWLPVGFTSAGAVSRCVAFTARYFEAMGAFSDMVAAPESESPHGDRGIARHLAALPGRFVWRPLMMNWKQL